MPHHAGLGAGTQLGLAVARAMAIAAGHEDWDAPELARRVGRGLRSGVGVHGFGRGGFLVEAGKRSQECLAPLITRVDFPESWRVVLVLSLGCSPWHGTEEQQAFRQLAGEERVLRITGVVRQQDVGFGSVVQSQSVANFRVSYLGRGPASRFTNQSLWGRAVNLVWP